MQRPRVCFVCLGNICRSPTAEGVFRHLVDAADLGSAIEIDSAGTGGWHAGEPPDPRSVAAAKRRGVRVGGQARKFVAADFARFDYVVAMDTANRENLLALARTPEDRAKVSLLLDHAPGLAGQSVPDPYYGGSRGFDEVLDLCDRGCAGLLDAIRERFAI